MKKINLLTLLLLIVPLTACGNNGGGNTPIDPPIVDPTLSSISVTPPTKLTYDIDEELDLTGFKVTANYSDGTNKDVTSQASLSGFDSSEAGEVTVTVTYDGQTDSFVVTIIDSELVTVTLNKHELTLMMDHYETLVATIDPKPTNIYSRASFSSSDEKVATIDSDGKIFPMGIGECVITASYNDASDTCQLEITPWIEGDVVHVASISYPESSIVLNDIGDTKMIMMNFTPQNATDKGLTYSSSNEDVVIVDENGVVTATGNGSAIITVTTVDISNKKDTINVVVKQSGVDYGYNHYNDYYGELTWTDGEDLMSKLYTISHKTYTALTYSANWETNQLADQDLYNHEMVDVVYASNTYPKTLTYKAGNGGWQREHAFAASLMTGQLTGDATNTKGRATDFHNLFASDQHGNSSRGNKNLGYANVEASTYKNFGDYSYDVKNFEPANNDKGRLARAIFYMGMMYSITENSNYQPLTIQEDYVDYSASTPCQFAIGNLSTLLEWNSFAVDYVEYQHNESVYSHVFSGNNAAQGNRNPFVDYPELVEYVYGSLKNQSGDLRYLAPSEDKLETSKTDTHHYAIKDVNTKFMIGDVFDSDDYTLLEVDYGLNEKIASTDLTTPYTFTKNDVGEKEVTVKTPINDIKYNVTVEEKSDRIAIEDCKYYTGDPLTKANYVSQLAKVKMTITPTANISQYSSNGILIPKGSGDVTLTSEAFSNVTEIAFKTNTNKNVGYHILITVGGQEVYNQNLTGLGRGTDPVAEYVLLEQPLSGSIIILVTNLTEAFYIAAIGVQAD